MNYVSLGHNAFATWVGEALPRIDERYSHELEAIGRALYDPPGENDTQDHSSPKADLHSAWLAKKMGLTPQSFWPNDAPYALCVTHDIDRIFSSIHALKRPGSLSKKLFNVGKDVASSLVEAWHERNPFFNFHRIEALEREWQIPSACYVLFEKRRLGYALKNRELQHVIGVYDPKSLYRHLRKYQRNGNEVGIHGSFDSWNSAQALEKEKKTLQSNGIERINGIRNHYLNFDPQVSPSVQRDCGFVYDSTMGFNFVVGFRSGTSFPYPLNGVWELPFQLMDSTLAYQFPKAEDQKRASFHILDQVRSVGGALVVNWHFRHMNPETSPETVELLQDVILAAKKDGAWITTPTELVENWEARRLTLSPNSTQRVRNTGR